jgi:MFS transporter, ACS family, hexuronate transporter
MATTTLPRPASSNIRWIICALLFFATTISYLDRQVLSLLAKTLEKEIGWNSIQYGYITACFQAAYAVGLLGAGRVIDAIGTRKGFALAIAVWSLAAIGHAAAASAVAFGVARAFLGLGEASNFPACIKTVAEWFPKKERAFATGIFNSGANIGAVVAPLTVPWMAVTLGWQSTFIATGLIGFVWLAGWLWLYKRPEEHPHVSQAELDLILTDPPDEGKSTPWVRLFPCKETWAFSLGKFLTDPVWMFFLFWLPKYLQETFNLKLTEVIVPTLVMYNVSTVGSIGGGWLSSAMIKRGASVNTARKTTMLICALCVVPVIYAPYCKSLWGVIGLISLALAAHQGWSANLFTLTSDVFPRSAVGSVVGIGGTAGAIGNVLIMVVAGYIVQWTNSYLAIFVFAGLAYLIALLVIQTLTPKLAPAKLD